MRVQKTARVVIGAQFGDEGKGRMIDYYAAEVGCDGIVIRFNGGAQAGHTVVTPDGLRHVFSHVGSGAFVGAATFLSRFFVSNPILFLKEMESLAAKDVEPRIYVDPQSPVTTPYDMMINQIVERERGGDRHGSCGVGFGETIERNLTPAYALTVADLADLSALAGKLDAIRRDYAPARLARLGFADAFARNANLLLSDAILEHFIKDAGRFVETITVADARVATRGRHLLFEGAQGLLLDQDRGFFPHVTRSNTGLYNVLALAGELGLREFEVTYATRAYLTRHGAGPMPHELPEKPYPDVVDATNVPNAYQGTLRFGWLDLDVLRHAIAEDLADAGRLPGLAIKARLAITCLDQVGDDKVRYYSGGMRRRASIESFVAAVSATVGIDKILLGFGADRESIMQRLKAIPIIANLYP
ncbi:MAG: adenylosuccinate synthetase [Candidatus Contendobacter sp.]|nr:adenylosuccinate synthetase [Candidatus Contendobacter sp.]MDG4557359.1 adenylosuccinate synthetase [Candidatus Contendobacter sp.]